MGSGGFEPSKAEPTDLQHSFSHIFLIIYAYIDINSIKSQCFFYKIAYFYILKIIYTYGVVPVYVPVYMPVRRNRLRRLGLRPNW